MGHDKEIGEYKNNTKLMNHYKGATLEKKVMLSPSAKIKILPSSPSIFSLLYAMVIKGRFLRKWHI